MERLKPPNGIRRGTLVELVSASIPTLTGEVRSQARPADDAQRSESELQLIVWCRTAGTKSSRISPRIATVPTPRCPIGASGWSAMGAAAEMSISS
jgi:hypothetical protein